MRTTHDRPKTVPHPIKFHRLKAVLALRQLPLQDFCRGLPVTQRHAQFVLVGARTGSAALLDAIQTALGESDWRFICGEVDTLTAERDRHAGA